MNINKSSKSHLTGKTYLIPENTDDSEKINSFLNLNKGKKIIVVQGLGFVGAVMSIVCANALHEEYVVIGIDLPSPESYWKICSINEGIFPIISADKKVEEYFQNSIKKNNFYATSDTYAFTKADVVIVDINLDVQKQTDHIQSNKIVDYSVNLSGFESAIKSIGDKCKEDILILIETTVPPGTTNLARKIIQDCLSHRNLNPEKIKIGHSYERVMPGPNYIDSIQNFYRVYSGVNDHSADYVEKFLKTIIHVDEYPLTRLKSTNATEMSKVLENSFRAMNIAFIVEWSRYAEEAGVDLYEVVNAIRMRPTHKNLMLPGIGVGGYCLTKDPLLASWSKQNLIGGDNGLYMSEMAVSTNDNMPVYAFNSLKNLFKDSSIKNKNIYFLGVSYAPDVGDTRYSPVELFCKLLKEQECTMYFNDPFVAFWEEMNVDVKNNFNDLSKPLDIVVISTGHTLYKKNKDLLNKIFDKDKLVIFDTIGILSDDEIALLSKKHIVKVLGRGDI
tara:strand:- start:610 stop:2118 length:1509 start_codon:yes stop_codon:yes gene_type:complete